MYMLVRYYNINYELTINKPENGLYFYNSRLLPFIAKTIIIGPITIEINVDDNFGVDRTEFYLDGELMNTDTSSLPEWYMNIGIICIRVTSIIDHC